MPALSRARGWFAPEPRPLCGKSGAMRPPRLPSEQFVNARAPPKGKAALTVRRAYSHMQKETRRVSFAADSTQRLSLALLRSRGFSLIPSLFRDVRTSLSPVSELDAQVVNQQLDMVRAGIRLLDYLLPVAGGVIVFLANMPPGFVPLWWVALIALCAGNEIFLSRQRLPEDLVARARLRARQFVVIGLALTLVWTLVTYLGWQPGPEHRINHLFNLFLLACTLAVASTMLSLHAATALLPVLLIAAVLILTPILEDARRNDAFIGIAAIYVLLMFGQANAIHSRVARMLRLQNERAELIERLREVTAETDTARRQAEDASRAKSAFLANMSHELRTPLNAIIGFSDIIRSRGVGAGVDKYQEYGGFIHGSGHKLLNLINDLLDIATIDAGQKVLNREDVDLGMLAAAAVAAARSDCDPQLTIRCEVGPNLPRIQADRRALMQMLNHLLSNAIKFTRPPGTITVAIARGEDGTVMMRVVDTGAGIAPDDQARIFEQLGQREPRVTSSGRGIGLGLTLVKALVELHGGAVVLQSQLGKGTSVTVCLPLIRGDERARVA
jgi:two-component system, cell cycle sensor histidine kinase PleC